MRIFRCLVRLESPCDEHVEAFLSRVRQICLNSQAFRPGEWRLADLDEESIGSKSPATDIKRGVAIGPSLFTSRADLSESGRHEPYDLQAGMSRSVRNLLLFLALRGIDREVSLARTGKR